MFLRLTLITTLLGLTWGCRTGVSTIARIEDMARKRFINFELLFNESRSFVVVVEKNSTNAAGTLTYVIFNCASGKQFTEGNFRPGSIKWISDNEVEVFDAPGIIRPDENIDGFKKIITVRKPEH